MRDINEISDVSAENGVIATLFQHPNFILHSEYLKAGYFKSKEHGCIYWAIQELYKNGITNIDAANIQHMANSNKGIKHYLESINISSIEKIEEISKYSAKHTIEEYKLMVKIVFEKAYKRELFKVSDELKSLCFKDLDLDEIDSAITDKVTSLEESFLIGEDFKLFGDIVDDLFEEIEEIEENGGQSGLPSKWESFNKYFTYDPAELVLIMARMKKGKSALFLNEAVHKLKMGCSVLYFDTEMSDKQFFNRIIANISGVGVNDIKNARYGQEDKKKIIEAMEWLKKQKFVHIYITNPTEFEIMNYCKIMQAKHGLDFVIFDYIKSDETSTSDNYNILGRMTNFLKNDVAGELDVPVLAGAQLNRSDEIADSDKILRYISTAIQWREKTPEELSRDGNKGGNFCARVKENRNGDQMSEEEIINFVFNGRIMLIEEAAVQPNDSENKGITYDDKGELPWSTTMNN